MGDPGAGMMCAFLAPFLPPSHNSGLSARRLFLPFLRTPMQPHRGHQKPQRARHALGKAQAVLPTSSVEPGVLSHHVQGWRDIRKHLPKHSSAAQIPPSNINKGQTIGCITDSVLLGGPAIKNTKH